MTQTRLNNPAQRSKKMKAAISQNVTCVVETAALTTLYAAVLFAGVQVLLSLV